MVGFVNTAMKVGFLQKTGNCLHRCAIRERRCNMELVYFVRTHYLCIMYTKANTHEVTIVNII